MLQAPSIGLKRGAHSLFDTIQLTSDFKTTVQSHSHFTYYIMRYTTVWWVLSKHDSSSQSGNTLRICTIISEIK